MSRYQDLVREQSRVPVSGLDTSNCSVGTASEINEPRAMIATSKPIPGNRLHQG